MMKLVPYLNFDGTCREAFRFYQACLGGKIAFEQTYGETPAKDGVPADFQDKLVHIRLEAPGVVLLGSDAPPSFYAPAQGTTLTLLLDDVNRAKQTFDQLMEGGRIVMPFARTFWSPGYGMGVDRFGKPWMVNTEPS
jgi:PhnB protein